MPSRTPSPQPHETARDEARDEEKASPAKGEEQHESKDPYLVAWDADEPANPRNWSTAYKSWITFQLGMLALAASLGSSVVSPAEDDIAAYVGVSSEVVVLMISLYM